MNKKLKEAKKSYENVEIPKELSKVINNTIKKSRIKRLQFLISTAALIILALNTVALNTSVVYANTLKDIPVLSNIAKVFTFKEYKEKEEFIDADITIPSVDIKNAKYENVINDKIHSKMNNLIDESRKRGKEYKKAFLARGGKEENFRPLKVFMDYEVKSFDNNILSFVIYKTETLGSSHDKAYYYNIDLEINENLKLDDVIDSKKYVNELIKKMIDKNIKNYFTDDDGFKSIEDDQQFYINKDGNIVIVFDEYEIAPGSTGRPEFEIK